jgi:hypothetical protein
MIEQLIVKLTGHYLVPRLRINGPLLHSPIRGSCMTSMVMRLKKIWSWVPRDPELRVTGLARACSNLPDPTPKVFMPWFLYVIKDKDFTFVLRRWWLRISARTSTILTEIFVVFFSLQEQAGMVSRWDTVAYFQILSNLSVIQSSNATVYILTVS